MAPGDARPAHPVLGIDHVLLMATDLRGSAAAYARLGFTLSPRGLHSTSMGTANHTLVFERDYVELLGIVSPTEANAPRRETLARDGEGLHAIACRTDDAEAAGKALAAYAIAAGPARRFSRPVVQPDGSEAVAAFRTLDIAPQDVPVGHMFVCEHQTPEAVWTAPLMHHANGAKALAAVIVSARNGSASELGAAFSRLFADGSVESADGGVRVATGEASAAILVLSDEALAARYGALDLSALPRGGYAAIRIAVGDLEDTRQCLSRAGVGAVTTPGGLAVGPGEACGAIVEFVTG